MTFASALNCNLHTFFCCLPLVRDGDPDAIHDARIASRRLRAIMSFAAAPSEQSEAAKRLLRSAGRLLGRARDLDVAEDVVRDLQRRLPSAAHLTSLAASHIDRRRQKQRRRLIKGLDDLPLEELRLISQALGRPSRTIIESAISLRAEKLRDAIVAAGGVYMPNRTHKVRIQIKKLRYMLEPFNGENVAADIRQLKRVQKVLGELRDKQAVAELIDRLDAGQAERDAVLTLLEQECLDSFARYLPHRPAILTICNESHWRRRRDWRAAITPIAALVTVAAPPAIGWLTNRGADLRSSRRNAQPNPATNDQELVLVGK